MSFWKWSQTAANNATADSTINWAEGQAPSSVNDSARAMMAAAAKYRDDIKGVTTGGTSTAYMIASNQVFDSLAHLDGALLCIIPHATSGAAPTLNVDGLGAKPVNSSTGVAVLTGALIASIPTFVRYANASNEFIVAGTTIIPAASITYAKIQNVAAGKFLGGNLTGAAAAAPSENTVPFGQCRLSKSGSNLLLAPCRGNLITINSQAVQIPDAGVTLSTGGLAATTLYYIYAFMSSGTMTLEASTTAYATQAGTGIAIKSGDATRTLVGLARTDGSVAWADSVTQRFVRSYFNDPGIALSNAFASAQSTASSSYVEISSLIRIEFLIWAGETMVVSANGTVANTQNNAQTQTSIGFDGATAEDTFSAAQNQSGTAGIVFPMAVEIVKTGLSEGYHFATLLGSNGGAGTAQWGGSGANGSRTAMRGFARFS